MKCIIISENLKKALSIIDHATGKDSTLPILGSFLISAENGVITITGTNLEVGMQTTLRGTIHTQGQVVVPARPFLGYSATLPKDEKVTIESEGNDAKIITQSHESLFKGYPPEDFPPFPVVRELYALTCKGSDLSGVLKRTIFSVSKTTVKPELASISFSFEREILTLAATDSFRLSEEKIKPIKFSAKLSKTSFLVPVTSCEELVRLIDYSDDENTEFLIGKGEICIKSNDVVLYSRLTEGTFPDYQQIIPQKFTTSLVVSRSVLAGNMKRASVFANKLSGISIALNPKQKTLTIESKNSLGTHKASVAADIQGEALTMVFNYHYFLDGIESYTEDALFLGLNSESQPLLIRPAKKEGSIYIIMPMKGGA